MNRISKPLWWGLAASSIALWASARMLNKLGRSHGWGSLHGMKTNLTLAWAPLVFALLWGGLRARTDTSRHLAWPTALLWLVFYPNAPYLSTEFLHLPGIDPQLYWPSMVVLMGCACLGLLLGYLSLEQFRAGWAARRGEWSSWVFVAAVSLVSGVGIYFGRFLRVNSWWVFTRPERTGDKLEQWADQLLDNPRGLTFALAFAALIFSSHAVLHLFRGAPAAPLSGCRAAG